MVVAVVATYSSLIGSARALDRSIAGDSDLAVLGFADTGFDMRLRDEIAGVPGVRAAVPLLQRTVAEPDPVTIIGVDPSLAQLRSPLQAALMSQLRLAPGLLTAGDAVVVGAQMNVAVGQRFRFQDHEATVAAVVPAQFAARVNGGHFVIAPLLSAQKISGRTGQVDAVYVVADDGADLDDLRTRIAAAIDNRALVTSGDLHSEQVRNALILTRSVTLLVAAVSFVVAAFLMFNATTMAVSQRRPMIAMLRAVGARRRLVVSDLLVEATLTGVAAAVIGIPLGLLLAHWAIDRTPAFLLQIVSARLEFEFSPWMYPAVAAICIVTSVAASLIAAHQVARTAPSEALRTASIAPGEPIPVRLRCWAFLVALVCMALTPVIATRVGDLFVVSAVAVLTCGLLALGLAAAGPIVAIAGWFGRWAGPSGRMAAASIHRAPRRTWATAMTVGIAVTIGIAVNGALGDLVQSASGTFDPLRRTDLLITVAGQEGFPTTILPRTWEERVRAGQGVAEVAGGQWAYVTLGEHRVQVAGLTEGTANIADLLPPQVRADVLAGRGVVVSRLLADRLGVSVGSEITVGTPTGTRESVVLGEFGYLSVDAGVIAMDLDAMREWFDRPGSSYLSVTLASGTDSSAVRAGLQSALGTEAKISTGEDAYAYSLFNIDQAGIFAVGLQWIVALLASFAVMNTLLLAVVQRRREIGVLRAMGAGRPFIGRLILVEALAVAVVGGGMGLIGGAVVHLLADRVLSVLTGIEVLYELDLVALWSTVIAVLVCIAGAVPPAIRAARLDVIAAVAAE